MVAENKYTNTRLKIYPAEVALGLESSLRASAKVISCGNPAKLSKFRAQAHATMTDASNYDLYPLQDIMVSAGWNLNDDVFGKDELWKAKHTPVNKPFDYEHDPSDILGHIVAAYPADEEGTVLPMDMLAQDLPDKFNIITEAYLYKFNETPLEKRMGKIIAEIEKGEWYVSMEALFDDFDYALMSPAGDNRVLNRNESTAGLSKYLRSAGGTGEYNGYKIGRLLKNVTFVGKGLVKRPANPNSVILNNFANASIMSAKEVTVMSNTNRTKADDELTADAFRHQAGPDGKYPLPPTTSYADASGVEDLKKELDAIKDAHAKLKSAHADAMTELNKHAASKHDELMARLSKADADKQELHAKLTATQTAHDDLHSKYTTLKTEADNWRAKLSTLENEKAVASRMATLASRNVTGEKADKLVRTCAGLSDEQFNDVISVFSVDGKTEKPSKTTIDNAVVVPEPTLAVASETETRANKVRADIAQYMLNNKVGE